MRITQIDNLEKVPTRHSERVTKQLIIPFGEYDQLVQFAGAEVPPGETVPGHSHPDMIEVFYITAGEGSIIIDEESYPLTAGTAVTIDIGETHEINNTTADTTLQMFFFAFRP